MAKKDNTKAKKASSKMVCACRQAKRCSNLQEQLAKLKYNKFVGYMRVQTKYSTADLGKVAERHRRICAHLKLVPIKTKKATTNNSRVNIAYHHFDDDMIVKHGAIIDTINFEESRKIIIALYLSYDVRLLGDEESYRTQ